MQLHRGSIIVVLGVVAGSLPFLYETFRLPVTRISSVPGPRFFPLVALAGLFSMSLLVILGEILRGRANARNQRGEAAGQEGAAERQGSTSRLFLVIGSLILYVVLMNIAGFILSSVVFLAGLIYALDIKRELTWLYYIGIAVALVIGIYAAFSLGFKVQLPSGWW